MGGGFFFGGIFLAVLTFAALPTFKMFWNEGNGFDKSICIFFIIALALYPIFASACFFYDEKVSIKKTKNKSYKIFKKRSVLFIPYFKEEIEINDLKNDLFLDNWKGKLNTAALKEMKTGEKERYATKGHWLLKFKKKETSFVEARARKEEVEWLWSTLITWFEEEKAEVTANPKSPAP